MKRFLLLLPLTILFAASPSGVERITVGEPVIIESKRDVMFDKPVYLLSKVKRGEVYRYTLTIYEPGNYTIKIGDRLYDIEVVSVLKGGEELQEIIGPLSIRGNPRWILIRVGIVLFFFLMIGVVYLLMRRGEIRELTPEEELGVSLVNAEEKLSSKDMDGFYTTLSFSLRKYLQRKFNLPALSMTSGELRDKVEEWIGDVVKRAELVRFGGVPVNLKTAEKDLNLARTYLKERENEISET